MSSGVRRPSHVVKVVPCRYSLCDNAVGQARLRKWRARFDPEDGTCPCRMDAARAENVLVQMAWLDAP